MKGLTYTLKWVWEHNASLKIDEDILTLKLRIFGWIVVRGCQCLGSCQVQKKASQTSGSLLEQMLVLNSLSL